MNPFYQGYLDGMCGVYSIINADKVINNSTSTESQELFNSVVEYLDSLNILSSIIIEGMNHKILANVMRDVVGDRIPYQVSNRKNFTKLKDWWQYSYQYLTEKTNRAIILSLGGKYNHLTVATKLGERSITILDSSWGVKVRRSDCALVGYTKDDKYVIYPSQCWYLGKE